MDTGKFTSKLAFRIDVYDVLLMAISILKNVTIDWGALAFELLRRLGSVRKRGNS